MSEKKVTLNRRQFLKASTAAVAGATIATQVGPVAASSTQPARRSKIARRDAEVSVMMNAGELSDAEIEQFQDENPGIVINRVDLDQTRFFAMLAAGEAPDLYRITAPELPPLIGRGIVTPLQEYFDASSVLNMDDLTSANDYYKANSPTEIGVGPIYGMCKDASPDLTVWANLDMFEQVGLDAPSIDEPLDYTDIMDMAQTLTQWDGDRLVSWGYGWENNWNERLWQVWLMGLGESMYSDDHKSANLVNNDELREAAQWMIDIAKSKATISPVNPTDSWPGQDFGNRRLAMMQYGFWFSGMLDMWAGGGDEELAALLDAGKMVMLPAPTWKGVRLDPTVSATGFTMTADSNVKDEAFRVFEWYMGEEPAINRAKSGWGVPALKSLFDMVPQEGAFRAPVWQALQGELEFMNTVVPFNPYLTDGVVTGLFNQYWGDILNGNMDLDTVLMLMEDEANFAIEEGIDRMS